MAIPKRKYLMIGKMINNRKPKINNQEKKEITEEEHQKRLQKLKEIGLLK